MGVLILVALLGVDNWFPWAGEGKPLYVVERACVRPELGVAWDAGAWGDAGTGVVECFLNEPGFRPTTEFRVLYDDAGVYVSFRVRDKFVRSVATEYRGKVWEDACVEFFVQPKAERGYFNFEINCGGTLLLSYHENPRYVPKEGEKDGAVPWEVAKSVLIRPSMGPTTEPEIKTETTWFVQYHVPREVFERYVGPLGDLAGQVWRANFYKCAETNSNPHWASWSRILEGMEFHSPRYFGLIRFAGEAD